MMAHLFLSCLIHSLLLGLYFSLLLCLLLGLLFYLAFIRALGLVLRLDILLGLNLGSLTGLLLRLGADACAIFQPIAVPVSGLITILISLLQSRNIRLENPYKK